MASEGHVPDPVAGMATTARHHAGGSARLELWGGAECTVNRIADEFGDQSILTGHHHRPGDMDLLADLGLAAVRFPILWERVSPDSPDSQDWVWTDACLDKLQRAAIRPIAGLVHHGSGPAYTSLLEHSFATGLAAHALAAARRYPWINDWTPVNEPLTTARFSALYGHWYPHVRDERLFWTALLNQVDAVRLSMRAIRTVIPSARLIQTEDLGRTFSTALLEDQAGFDNARRWMTWDLLCGRVVPGHAMWERLCDFGQQRQLRVLANDPCPPDIIGINHYLTSNRFLDHRVTRYPLHPPGGNDAIPFADVEAVRVLRPAPQDVAGALGDAWDRYRIPLALTEVHNGSTREEQVRWFLSAWQAATAARQAGADVRAVTSWAIFGSAGWNTLLTGGGTYEPGAYDVSSGTPRATALVPILQALSRGEMPKLDWGGEGWWRRPIRFHHPVAARAAPVSELAIAGNSGKRTGSILILGSSGTLGRALAAACQHRDLNHVLTGRNEIDLGDPDGFARALDRIAPWSVINAAGWVRVDDAEVEREACLAVNTSGAVALVRACQTRGIPTLSFSSDLVFDGAQDSYDEAARPRALNVYGASKAAMEEQILALGGKHLIARTAAFFSPFDPHNFAMQLMRSLWAGRRFQAAVDYAVSPAYVPDLCNVSLDLLIDREIGIFHVTNEERVSWYDFAVRIADACGIDGAKVKAVAGGELGWQAARPRSSALVSLRSHLMPSLESAIGRFAASFALV